MLEHRPSEAKITTKAPTFPLNAIFYSNRPGIHMHLQKQISRHTLKSFTIFNKKNLITNQKYSIYTNTIVMQLCTQYTYDLIQKSCLNGVHNLTFMHICSFVECTWFLPIYHRFARLDLHTWNYRAYHQFPPKINSHMIQKTVKIFGISSIDLDAYAHCWV